MSHRSLSPAARLMLVLAAAAPFALAGCTPTAAPAPTPTAASTSAAEIAVDCDAGGTITDALAAAAPRAVVTVTGTCEETVLIPRALTGLTLDGGGASSIVGPPADTEPTSPASFTIFSEAVGVAITGFTIEGGAHAIHLSGPASATIEGNTIRDSGGAIHLDKGSIAQILDNTIEGNAYGINLQEDSYARIGFRIPVLPELPGNVIRDNSGPGITVTQRSSAWVLGNTITGNDGHGVWVDRGSQADVQENEIGGNAGDGIRATGGSAVSLTGAGSARPEARPNTSQTPNGAAGLACAVGGSVDGPLGTLTGTAGPSVVSDGCVDVTESD